ncbi:MAG: methyltransferase domain-containing protein [Luteolibacter sp.]
MNPHDEIPRMTDWELQYRTGETPWDKGRAAPPLLEVLERGILAEWGNREILVPGCGVGHDVRALAARGFRPVGLDISPTAVKRAEAFPKTGPEIYEAGDFFDPAWREGKSFAGWWEHTCFCAIPPERRPDYAKAAGSLVEAGGLLAGVFYLTPNDPGEEDDGPPFNATIGEIRGLFAPWFDFLDGWVPRNTYPGRKGREWVGVFRRI